MEQFEILELIGEGSFGRVFKGRRKNQILSYVALKLIPKICHGEPELCNLRRECKIQKELSHPNIVCMLDAFETSKELIAVTEFVPGGDLHKLFAAHKVSSIPLPSLKTIALSLLSACAYLHSHRVLHRDIKPQNVLLSSEGTAKLCDFGFARNLGINTFVLTSIKGTPLYMAPELIEEQPYDYSADLWSVGCILYELLTGEPPFSTQSLFQLIKKVRYEAINWKFPKEILANVPEQCFDLLQRLLEKDFKKRLSWPLLLHHPYIESQLNLQGVKLSEFSCTESRELQKEMQRQDRIKILASNAGSTTQILSKLTQHNSGRRFSDHNTQISSRIHFRRPSDHSARCFLSFPENNNLTNNHHHEITKFEPPKDATGWIDTFEILIENEDEELERNYIIDVLLHMPSTEDIHYKFLLLIMSKYSNEDNPWIENVNLINHLHAFCEFSQKDDFLSLLSCLLSRLVMSSIEMRNEFLESYFLSSSQLNRLANVDIINIFNRCLYFTNKNTQLIRKVIQLLPKLMITFDETPEKHCYLLAILCTCCQSYKESFLPILEPYTETIISVSKNNNSKVVEKTLSLLLSCKS